MVNFFLSRLRNRWVRDRLKNKDLHPHARTNLTAYDHLNLSDKACSYHYVVVDLETTGLSLSHDRLVSIGAFRIVEGRIRLGEKFNRLVNPERNIPPSSVMFHGIVPDMVSGARPVEEVFDEFLAFLGVDILVAHLAAFDLHFLNQTMRVRHGFPLQNLVLDTRLMCREFVFPPHRHPYSIDSDPRRYNLESIAKHFGIEIQELHTALGDALITSLIFQRILAQMEKGGSGMLRCLVKAAGVF